MQARPRLPACVHGSVPLGWYLAPHRPKSLPNALSVSVSARCFASSCASCGSFGTTGGAVASATGTAEAPSSRDTAVEAAADTARACHGCTFHTVKVTALSTSAIAAVAAHGSQSGVKRRPNTSAAALRTSDAVTRCRSRE